LIFNVIDQLLEGELRHLLEDPEIFQKADHDLHLLLSGLSHYPAVGGFIEYCKIRVCVHTDYGGRARHVCGQSHFTKTLALLQDYHFFKVL
jgi:hypothetical protein